MSCNCLGCSGSCTLRYEANQKDEERAAGRRDGKELIESALSSLLNLSDEGWIDRRVVKAIEKLKE